MVLAAAAALGAWASPAAACSCAQTSPAGHYRNHQLDARVETQVEVLEEDVEVELVLEPLRP